MIPNFSGEYLNYNGTEDGDIITIASEGKMEYSETLKKELFNIDVLRNGKKMTYSPSNTAGTQLQLAFGKDTKDWLNQKFQVLHIDKKMLIRPIKSVAA